MATYQDRLDAGIEFLTECNEVMALELMTIIFSTEKDSVFNNKAVFENQYNALLEEIEELELAKNILEFADAVGDVYFVLKTLEPFLSADFAEEIDSKSKFAVISKIEDELANVPFTSFEKEMILEKVNASNYSKLSKFKAEAEKAVSEKYSGISVRISSVNGFFVIFSDADQEFNGKKIKKGKFLKSAGFFEPKLHELDFLNIKEGEELASFSYEFKNKNLKGMGVHSKKDKK